MNSFCEYGVFGICHPDGTPYRRDEYPAARAMLRGETVRQEEMRRPGPDGDLVLSERPAPIRDETGRIFADALNFQDIAERKGSEAERARLAAIVESSDDAIVRKNLDGTITHWNPAARRIYGYSAEEIVGRHARVLFPDELRGEEARLIARVARGRRIRGLETVRLARDGRRIGISLTLTAIPDAQGRPEAVSSIERDITERKKADRDLRTSRRHLELAATAGEIGIWNSDLTAGVAHWNAQLYAMLGLAPRIGPEDAEYFFSFIHPEDRRGVSRCVETVRDAGDDFAFEFRIVRADGEIRWLMAKGRMEHDAEGNPVFMRGVNTDVADRRRAEEALKVNRAALARKVEELERSNRELSEFAYAVSHDLKAPMRAVRNYANFPIDDLGDDLPETQRGYLDGMKRAIGQGDQLIGDPLDFSRIGQKPGQTEVFRLKDAVAEVKQLVDGESHDAVPSGTKARRWPPIGPC